MSNKTTVYFVLLWLLISFPNCVFAGLKITPALIRVDLSPGANYKTHITVQNSSLEKAEHIKVSLQTIEKSSDGKKEYSATEPGKMSIIEWSAIEPAKFTIQPEEKIELTLHLRIPKDINGDFRGAIMVSQDVEKMDLALNQKIDIDNLRMSKIDGYGMPQKVMRSIKQYYRVAIPVYIRLNQKAVSKVKKRIRAKLGKLKIGVARSEEGSLKVSLPVENLGPFDLDVTGACRILHGTQKNLLLITDLSDKKLTVLPQSKRKAEFIFSDPIPAGNYFASVKLNLQNKGFDNRVVKNSKTGFSVSPKMAERLTKNDDLTPGSNIPHTPLIVDVKSINIQQSGIRIKPVKITVTNPTNKNLTVRSFYRGISKSKPGGLGVRILPDKFTLKPGKSERVKIMINLDKKKAVFGRIIFGVKGMENNLPVDLPVMIIPKGAKLKASATINKLKTKPYNNGKSILISGNMNNNGAIHLQELSIQVVVKDFLENPLKTIWAKAGRNILLPSETTELTCNIPLPDLKSENYYAYVVVKSKGLTLVQKKFKLKAK